MTSTETDLDAHSITPDNGIQKVDETNSADFTVPTSVTLIVDSSERAETYAELSNRLFAGPEFAARCVIAKPAQPTRVSTEVPAQDTADETEDSAAPSKSEGLDSDLSHFHVKQVEVDAGLTFAQRLLLMIEIATTEYVLVAPDTGRLLPKAVDHMVETIEEHEVDFVSANMRHTSDVGDVIAPALSRSHQTDGLLEFRGGDDGLGDMQMCNKLYRARFLSDVLRECIDNELEDETEVGLAASCRASFYAVTSAVLVETPHPSETAALRRFRADIAELSREFRSILSGCRTLSALGEIELLHRWRVFSFDSLLSPHYQLIPRVSEVYWELFVAKLREVRDELTDEVLDELSLHNRILTHLILTDNRADCETVSYNRSDLGSLYQVVVKNGQLIGQPNYLPQLTKPLPEDLLVCRQHEVVHEAGILDYRWTTTTVLHLTGCAYVRGIDLSTVDHETYIELVNLSTGEQHRLAASQIELTAIDLLSNDRNLSYARAGFTVEIDTALLPGIDNSFIGDSPVWKVRVATDVEGIQAHSDFRWRDRSGAAAHLDVQPLIGTVRLVPTFGSSTGLELSLERPRYVVTDARLTGRTFTFQVTTPLDTIATNLRAECGDTGQHAVGALVSYDGKKAEYRLELPSANTKSGAKGDWEWKLVAESPAIPPVPLAWWDSESAFENSIDPGLALTTQLTGYGYIRIVERRWRMLVSDCRVSEDGLELLVNGTCDLDANQAPRIVLANSRGTIEATESCVLVSSALGSNQFSARFDLRMCAWGHEDLARQTGAYSLRYIPHGAEAAKGHWLLATPRLSNNLPNRHGSYKSTLEVSRTSKKGAIKVHIRPNLTDYEFTRFGQRSLQLKHFTGSDVDLTQPATGRYAVVECFGGLRATDTVLELVRRLRADYPDLPVYWGITDESVPLPIDVIGVVIDSEEWYERLSNARLLINNNNFPHYFRKRAGQYYLQTWHGTPLKRLVFDVDRSNFSLSYWALMAREATYWDLLIAQNEYAAEVLAKAFHYEGKVFYDGYPRNDVLNAPDSEDRRVAVRESLDIGSDQNVALYAPTWRDNVKASASQYAMVTYLDFNAFEAELGKEWTILLRGHHNVANSRKVSDLDVIDVTDYPEVNDLYLAADILITDYSSVMFDFNVTNKQTIFLTPDIDAYADSIRGFYFNLKEAAPGPMVRTTTGVIDAIKHLTLTKWRYTKKRREFKAKFAPLDDGAATERLYQILPLRSILK